jgi:FkbM family methyltransferase
MISYGFNFEDVYIQRLFPGKKDGFYIDVGAAHPTEGSVTRHFYDLGWRGINIEPQQAYIQQLKRERTRDINLQLAVGSREEERTFFSLDGKGGSTFDPVNANRGSAMGFNVAKQTLPMTTLRKVCETYVKGPIDFLKIDVEGWEQQVIEGADWRRFRPMLVLAEATVPFSSEPAFHGWEPLLLQAHYMFAFFDGLNRYYLRSEDAHLASRLAVPVNVFDDFKPYRQHLAEEALKDIQATPIKRTRLYKALKRFERKIRHLLRK